MKIDYNPNPMHAVLRKQEEHEARLKLIEEQFAAILETLKELSK